MKSRQRVLLVAPYYKPAVAFGGPTASLSALAEALVAEGIGVTVFTTNAAAPDMNMERSDFVDNTAGVEVHYFERLLLRQLPMYFYSPGLWRACHADMARFDVAYISATWTFPFIAAAHAAGRAQVPFVVAPKGSFMDAAMAHSRLKKALYLKLVELPYMKKARLIHCTSELEAAQTSRLGLRTLVIPNSLNTARFDRIPQAGLFRERLGIPASAPLSIFVGRLHAEKRLDLIVNAFSAVSQLVPDAHLALLGEDYGEHTRCLRLIEDSPARDRIHLCGPASSQDLLPVYADADLLVLLSIRENFGMVVAEAMAAGLPVLITDTVGIAPEVLHARAGFVVRDEFAAIVNQWVLALTDDDLRAYGQRGAKAARARFSQGAVATQMREAFSGVGSR